MSANGSFQPSTFPKLFEAREYRPSSGEHQGRLLRYRLFVPRNLRPGEQCPLLVWLHGKGEGGDDNEWSLKYLPMIVQPSRPVEEYRFFILATQSPSGSWSSGYDDSSGDMLAVTYAIVQQLLKEQPIDPDRVYLSGVSSGGAGCWEMAMRHPELFAAVAPMSSGGGDASRVGKLVNIPIWAFHCQYDKPEGVEQTVAALQHAGGNVYLTLMRSGDHDSWHGALCGFGCFDWLLAQRRGASIRWTPPGHSAWRWWHILGVPIAFVALAGLAFWSERKRRTQRAKHPKVLSQEDATVAS